MRNATLSVLCLLMLGVGSAASTAAAQTDDTELPAAEGEGTPDAAESEGAAGAEEATPGESGADESEPEPEVSTPAEPASGTLAAPQSELEEGDVEDEAAQSEAEEEPAAAPAPELPWRNTFFNWTHQVTFNSFLRDAQLSYNPLYVQAFSLSPRWYLQPSSYFIAIQSLQLEITDADGDALNRDPQLGDTIVEFRQMLPWEGFMFMGQARVILPVSKISQAAQVYLGTGLGLTVVRPIPEINLTLAGVFRWGHTFAGSNVVRVGEPQPDMCPAAPLVSTPEAAGGAPEFATSSCDQLGTATTGRDSILTGIFATLAFDALTINVQAFFFSLYGHELAPAYIDVATSEQPLMIADGSPSHWRNFTYFALSLGYQFTPWLNLSAGIQNSHIVASAYNSDGSIRNPLFTPDTQVFLSATLQIDTIYTELEGAGDDGLTPEERQRRRQGLAAAPAAGGTF